MTLFFRFTLHQALSIILMIALVGLSVFATLAALLAGNVVNAIAVILFILIGLAIAAKRSWLASQITPLNKVTPPAYTDNLLMAQNFIYHQIRKNPTTKSSPKLGMVQNNSIKAQINAFYAEKIGLKKDWILFTPEFLRAWGHGVLNEAQIKGVLAHELGHFYQNSSMATLARWLMFFNLAMALSNLAVALVSSVSFVPIVEGFYTMFLLFPVLAHPACFWLFRNVEHQQELLADLFSSQIGYGEQTLSFLRLSQNHHLVLNSELKYFWPHQWIRGSLEASENYIYSPQDASERTEMLNIIALNLKAKGELFATASLPRQAYCYAATALKWLQLFWRGDFFPSHPELSRREKVLRQVKT